MPRHGSTTSPKSKKEKTVPLSPKFRRFIEQTRDIEKSWTGNYDGILESWHEDCLKFVDGKVGKVLPHVVRFLASDVFGLRYRTASNSKPDTYAFREDLSPISQ
jgi:hypothetical protein